MRVLPSLTCIAVCMALYQPQAQAVAPLEPNLAAQIGFGVGQQTGAISGRVINQSTGSTLPSARVRLLELERDTATRRDGSFLLGNIESGTYTLEVSYDGLDTHSVSIDIVAGEITRQDVRLTGALFDGERILVRSRAEGYASSMNVQRHGDSFRTVVSADALGQIREGNIGDALVRLPGMSVETRAGVQRTATIRGLAPQYNTVTVDGIRMTNVDGNRNIALDSFPANLLARVDVVKAPTPDMTADAIGGTVDLVTRSAYDSEERTLETQLGTTYNDHNGSWNRQAGVTLGDTFGSDNQFGLLGSVFYFRDERGYDVINNGYALDEDGEYILSRSLQYDRDEKKDKVGAGLMFDYRPGNNTSAYLKALYHYDYRWLWRRATDYRPNLQTAELLDDGRVSSENGRIDAVTFYREPKNVFHMYNAGFEHRGYDWLVDGQIAYSRAKKDYPVTLQLVNSFNQVDLTYDRSQPDFPSFEITNGVDVTDPNTIAFRQYQTNQVPRLEEEYTFDVNAAREFIGPFFNMTFKTGARATLKEAGQSQPDTIRYTGLDGIDATELLEFYQNPDFMSPSGGRAQLGTLFPDWRAYLALHESDDGRLTQNEAAQFYTASTIANADFDISEDIYATYAMSTFDFDPTDYYDYFSILVGARFESTHLSSQANEVISDGNDISAINRVSGNSSYNNFLPSIHARYALPNSSLVLRSSISKAISRPPPGDLIPSVQENSQLNQRVVGNPNLRPAESINYDISAEYYMPPLGVISAALFYKDIDNFVFSTSRIANDGVDERTRVNGEGGSVTGAEFVWQQQLTFLPGALSGFGVEANYTWLDTKGVYPGRESERLELVNSPRYIANAVLSYAAGPASARLSVNRLPDRIAAIGNQEALDRYIEGSTVWDLAMQYELGRNHNLFFNVKNLTNEPTREFIGDSSNPTSVIYYGRQFNLGINLSF